MRRHILAVVVLLTSGSVASLAGGPAFVAGSGYNLGVEGQALIWANGSVQYFTDQGDLSPILTGSQADALVATAFSTWTSISGVALTATQGGHLAEDVNGSDIETNGFGVVTAPADISSSATGTPVGIVYDYDGTVTDALLGDGAGDLSDCFTNAVYGEPDNFSASGNIVHSLVVINGICAATSAQLPDVQYRLVRVLARTLGVGWSQANVNVVTRQPPPDSDDFAGFPVMHFIDPISCVPIGACFPNAAVPKMDDMDSLMRLYPGGNAQPAGRIYGGLYFTDVSGNAAQPMQGVNVVARLMVSGIPSEQYVVTSASGFAFCGNAGNIIDGYVDENGLPYNRWGSDDPSLEGFFDLGELMIPPGQTIAQYQLSVEALDPYWSSGVESYAPTQVAPSGSFAPVVVTVTNGSNAERDILMLQSEIAQAHPGSGSTYANPGALPQGGAWGSWIAGYGSTDFFQFAVQANRTASVAVMALDETGAPTETKLLPVIGIWQLSDESGNPAPAATPSAFNSPVFGLSRLDAQFTATDTYRLAVADYRGDGRPDYFYQAHLLYSDTVTPARLSLAGGVATLSGTGFSPELLVTAGSNNASTLSASASQIQAAMPAGLQDGLATIQVMDAVSGAFSQMIGALTYGALASDRLLLLQGTEPFTPVGAAAANELRVRVVAADGVTPVNGATVAWGATNGLQFSACNGASSCSVLSDEVGESSSSVTPTATGASTITIAVAPASYSPPQAQQTTVVATSSTVDLVAVTPTRWIGQGATIAVPITVEMLDLGTPLPNVTINFKVTNGTASLSSGSAVTNSAGFATTSAMLTNQNADVQVSACVAPNNSPCQSFTLFSTPATAWTLETVSGSTQVVVTGQSFQPLVTRVTDGSPVANPVMGVTVAFETTLTEISTEQGGAPGGGDGDTAAANGPPILLGSSQARVVTSQSGLATVVPSAANVGPCDLFIAVSAATSNLQFEMENLAAIVGDSPVHVVGKTPHVPDVPQTGRATAEPQSSVIDLFALPLGDASAEPPPMPEALAPACTEPPADSASDHGNSRPNPEVQGGHDGNVSCPASKLPEPAEKQSASAVQKKIIVSDAALVVETQSNLVSSFPFPDDKRSCRVLAEDSFLP